MARALLPGTARRHVRQARCGCPSPLPVPDLLSASIAACPAWACIHPPKQSAPILWRPPPCTKQNMIAACRFIPVFPLLNSTVATVIDDLQRSFHHNFQVEMRPNMPDHLQHRFLQPFHVQQRFFLRRTDRTEIYFQLRFRARWTNGEPGRI